MLVRKSNFLRAFTLIELIAVIIVIGILAAFTIPLYLNTQEKIRDQEAETNLKLIQAAEKIYRIEARGYIRTTDTVNINSLLKLDLPIGGYWSYSVPVINNQPVPPDPQTFCAQATRTLRPDVAESWHIGQSDAQAVDCDCRGASCTGR